MRRKLAAIGAALALAGAGSTAALGEDPDVLSIPDNSHDMQSTEPPAWAQGDAPPAYEESVIEMPAPAATIEVPAQTEPIPGADDAYVIEPDPEPATPSATGVTRDRAMRARP